MLSFSVVVVVVSRAVDKCDIPLYDNADDDDNKSELLNVARLSPHNNDEEYGDSSSTPMTARHNVISKVENFVDLCGLWCQGDDVAAGDNDDDDLDGWIE